MLGVLKHVRKIYVHSQLRTFLGAIRFSQGMYLCLNCCRQGMILEAMYNLGFARAGVRIRSEVHHVIYTNLE